MSKKVLIAYGTRFGSTEEVSIRIAEMLEKEGIESRLINLRETKEKEWPSIDEFDGILVGSSIKIGRWTKEAKRFLKHYKNKLQERETILGIFVCSATAAEDRAEATQKYVEAFMEEIGVKADIYDAFGGVLDLSDSSRMGFLDKKMMKMAAKQESEAVFVIKDGERNDLRDWDYIGKFADEFVKIVKK